MSFTAADYFAHSLNFWLALSHQSAEYWTNQTLYCLKHVKCLVVTVPNLVHMG